MFFSTAARGTTLHFRDLNRLNIQALNAERQLHQQLPHVPSVALQADGLNRSVQHTDPRAIPFNLLCPVSHYYSLVFIASSRGSPDDSPAEFHTTFGWVATIKTNPSSLQVFSSFCQEGVKIRSKHTNMIFKDGHSTTVHSSTVKILLSSFWKCFSATACGLVGLLGGEEEYATRAYRARSGLSKQLFTLD